MAWAHLSVQRGLPTWRSPLSQVCTAPVLCGLTVTGSGRLWGHYRATQRFCPPTVSTHSPHLPTDLRHLESAWGSRHPRFLGLPGALTRLGGTPPPPPWSCRGSSRLSPGELASVSGAALPSWLQTRFSRLRRAAAPRCFQSQAGCSPAWAATHLSAPAPLRFPGLPGP